MLCGYLQCDTMSFRPLRNALPALLHARTSEAQDGGPMYGRDFEDPDGHQWEPMWMDPTFAEQGAHPAETVEA